MSVFTFSELQSAAKLDLNYGRTVIQKSAAINEASRTASALNLTKDPDSRNYDIFLSHSFKDRIAILGLKSNFENMGFSTYVDWYCDPQLNRGAVSKSTSQQLRMRMKRAKTLIYAFSSNAAKSSWMPWELGFADGDKSRCSILRVEDESRVQIYSGFEYLQIYPYVDEATPKNKKNKTLWVNESSSCYVEYRQWIDGKNPTNRKA